MLSVLLCSKTYNTTTCAKDRVCADTGVDVLAEGAEDVDEPELDVEAGDAELLDVEAWKTMPSVEAMALVCGALASIFASVVVTGVAGFTSSCRWIGKNRFCFCVCTLKLTREFSVMHVRLFVAKSDSSAVLFSGMLKFLLDPDRRSGIELPAVALL
jgi:hypothetical protein